MNLELVKFINSDLTWNAVKKGHRSVMRRRRPRRTEASSSEFGFDCGDKLQESTVFDYEKSGVAILGQHFAEEVLDVPIKKRILLLQSPSFEGAWSAQPQIHEASEPLAGGKHASGAIKLVEKELPDQNDFSGIELLAAAACHSSVYDSPGHVESSVVEEHTKPLVVSYPNGIKQDISPMDSDDSSVQDSAFPVTQSMCDNEIDDEDKRHVPSKGVRLHWDLNTVMEEWDEPCDIPVEANSEKSYRRDAYCDALQNAKANLEGNETTKSQVTGDEQGNMLPEEKHDAGIQGKNDNDFLGKTHDAESCVSKSDVVDPFTPPAKREHVSTSTTSVSIVETIAKVESDDRQAVSEVVQGGCLSLKGDNADDKLSLEDHLSDCCGSNVSQDERGHMAEGNTADKVKSGYDSPVEDGELREPTWQKDELEERECVDYESDNMYEDNFDTIESLTNEIPLDHHETIGASDAVPKNVIEEGDKADALGSKTYEYQLQEHSRSVILKHKDGSSKKFSHEKKITLDEFPRRNLLYTDRSTSMSFGTSRNAACISRSRSDNIGDSYSRIERDFGQEKLMAREGPSYHASGQWGDSFSRNSHGYSRPKIIRSGGSSNLDSNQAISYNARGVSRTFNTRPSSSDRNEFYGIHRRTPPASGINHDRCRGGLRRAPQEEYNDPEPCYSQRKIPCFSSNYNRGSHVSRSRRRSRSRSRSGSPIAWHFQKKRNMDTKRQSPDHSSDTRFSFRKPSEVEAGGPVSPTRGRVSSERVSRSFDDRNIIRGPYRDRRSSPVRTFHRDQRFDPPRYLENLKSNDHFRPTPRPARFQPNREKFEANSNYSSVHDDKYGGILNERRRFRYDVQEPFKGCNFRNKDNGFRYTPEENRCFRDRVGKDLPEHTK